MLEVALIAVCIIAGVAYACGRVGYRLGAKSAARQITRVFQREITSKDNELDKVEGQLRRRKYIDLALDRLAQQLLQAAMGEGERQFQAALVRKPGEASVIMKGKDLEDIVWLADTGLQTWTANRDVPFRSGDRVSYARAEHLVKVLDRFERRIVPNLVLEPELEKQRRFDRADSRLVRLQDVYKQ
jgi:hypothetical protein